MSEALISSRPLQQDAEAVQTDCRIVNLLRVASSPVADDRQKQQALAALNNFRNDARVETFFVVRAEQERREQLRQRALNLKNRPIK